MIVQSLHGPYEIEFKEVDTCPIDAHRHTFIELIYIAKGTGTQHVNQEVREYYPENLFLMMPQDIHFFTCATTTSFLFIRFNKIYLEAQKAREDLASIADWTQKIEYIFHNGLHQPGCLIQDKEDKPLVRALMDALLKESDSQKTFRREVIQQLINTILTVVARNISQKQPVMTQEKSALSLNIVDYIHQNIYSPELLKASHLAAHFNISVNYISEYFKKQVGEGLQQYINNYKLRLVETRLAYSDMRIKEIVSELGFTDESHLNRSFSKYKGMSPSAFRRNRLSN